MQPARGDGDIINLFVILHKGTRTDIDVTDELSSRVVECVELLLVLSDDALLATSFSVGSTNGYTMSNWLYNLVLMPRFQRFKSNPAFMPAITATAKHFVNKYLCGLYLASQVPADRRHAVILKRLIRITGTPITAASMGILLLGVDSEVLGQTNGKYRQLFDTIRHTQ